MSNEVEQWKQLAETFKALADQAAPLITDLTEALKKAEAALAEAKLPSLEHVQSIYEIAKLKAACAGMRQTLEGIINHCVHPDVAIRAVMVDLAPVRHALSLDCGKGHIPVSALDKTIEFLKTKCPGMAGYCECVFHKEITRIESLRKDAD